MLIDMHTHSYYSDGDYSPAKVVLLAKNRNVSTLSITDHDALGASLYFLKNPILIPSGMEIIPGIEITGKIPNGPMHILGYGFDVYNKELNDAMKLQAQKRKNALLDVYNYIKTEYDICFSDDEINEVINSERSIGKTDLAKLLIKYKKVETVSEAFSKYLNKAHVMTKGNFDKGLPFQECLELILNAGGIPVLAHPKTLKLEKLEFLRLLEEMKDYGLKGIEVYHSIHTLSDINYYLEIANKYNFLVSGGSDFHGNIAKPNIKFGVTCKDKDIVLEGLSIVDELRIGSYKVLKKSAGLKL